MSQPTPISRSMMQNLKAEKDDNARQAQIKKIVEEIYKEAIQVAEKTADSSYNYEIPSTQIAHLAISDRKQAKADYLSRKKQYEDMLCNRYIVAPPFQHHYTQGGPDPFHIKNMPDILAGLRNLFPDCAVSHTLLCQAKDGKMYDIAKLDDAVLPFVDRALDQSYIIIDWS
jgi:hypothetical protein